MAGPMHRWRAPCSLLLAGFPVRIPSSIPAATGSKISKVDFPQIFATDFDDIKTVNGHHSDAQTVLIWSKSARKIGQKSLFEILKKKPN